MYQSPRIRRLRNDLVSLERLRAESSVFRFSSVGDTPQQYHILFHGKGLCRDRGKIKVIDQHRVEIKLGTSYPRGMPELRWVTPIYHPNISEIGMVCLGGYGTHWVPSVQLDELCVMLWDMVRYHNYDIRSPYNREAALWVAGQTNFRFPTDARPLRDLRASQGRLGGNAEGEATGFAGPRNGPDRPGRTAGTRLASGNTTPVARVLQFIERYGRVFGDDSPPTVGPPESSTTAAELRPEVARAPGFAGRSAESTANVRVPPPVQVHVNSSTMYDKLEGNAEAVVLAETKGPRVDAQADDVMILESSPEDARFEPARPANDEEVIFID